MDEASAALRRQDWRAAHAWVVYAGEVRRQPEPAAMRLTLHDIEAQTCPHDLLAVRDRRASTKWWLHAGDHTACELS